MMPDERQEPISHAALLRQRQDNQARHEQSVGRVGTLLERQRQVGSELNTGLSSLARQRDDLDEFERRDADGSLLAALVRPFVGRRQALARRSIAEALNRKYEQVSVRLRDATAFSDELRLCALELQAEVDRLHRDLADAQTHQRGCAARVIEIEHALAEVEADAAPNERLRDRYTFDLRSMSIEMALYGAAADLCRQHLDPARTLRDTVLRLHEEMANYVLSATHTVNAAGRRIGALGMLADAPAVVAELQQSLDALGFAIEATSQWVERNRRFVVDVLPQLSTQVQKETEATERALVLELRDHDRERAKYFAERTLLRAAEDEVAALLGEVER